MIHRFFAVALAMLVLAPTAALAQQSRAGVVTTLEGNVTARRVALPGPVPLKFKDDVFLQDTVATGDKSLARMLLGGKAVVTVRERSVLTITEVPGRSTIELESGKFALAVAREKMRPGEEIQIRTPNAIAGVRGTVVVTEVNRQSAQAGGALPAVVTNFFVLRGAIAAQRLDPTTRQPVGAPLQVGTLQAYTGAGTSAPSVAPVPPEQVGQITSGLQPSGPKGGGDAGKEQVKAQAVQTAAALLNTLTGGPEQQAAFATGGPPQGLAPQPPPPGHQPPPIVAVATQIAKAEDLAEEGKVLQAFAAALSEFLGIDVTITDKAVRSFTSSFTSSSTSALLTLSGAVLVFDGDDLNVVEVLPGADVTLAGPLARIHNSVVTQAEHLLDIEGGRLTSTSTSPLFDIDPTTIRTTSSLVIVDGAGRLSLAGPLLTDVDGVFVAGDAFVRLEEGATLSSTGTGALVQLTGTTVDAPAALSLENATMTLAGPLVTATNVRGGGDGLGAGGRALFGLSASTLSSTTTSPLITFTSTPADPEGSFFLLLDGSTVSLGGPLFAASGGALRSGSPDRLAAFVGVLDGSTLTSTSASSLISMSDVTFDSDGPLVNVRRSASTSDRSRLVLAGPLFSASNTTINTTTTGFGATFGTARPCCSVFGIQQGAVLASTGTSALISLTDSTVIVSDAQSGANFFALHDTVEGFPSSELVAPAFVSLAGPLLSASNSSIKALFALLQVRRSSFTSSTTSSLVNLLSSTVNVGGNDIDSTAIPGRLLYAVGSESNGNPGSPSSVTLSGPFLTAVGSTINATEAIGIFNGASVTSTSSGALLTLDSTALKLVTTTTHFGDLVAVAGAGGANGTTFSTLDLKGPLLRVGNGATLDMTGALAAVSPSGQITEAHPSEPFVSIRGGVQKIASTMGQAMFRLFGRSSATTTEVVNTPETSPSNTSTLTTGTDEPLKRSGAGPFLELGDNASATTHAVFTLDRALLQASAPLLHIKSGATLTSAADGLNLTANAKLVSLAGPLVRLDGGTLNITNGHALRVLNGSLLAVTTDLFSISNGGALAISNGSALFINGGSLVRISGGLVNFNNSTGSVSINNSFCSGACSSFGGVPIHFQNGATSSNVSITNAIKNSGSATVNLNNASTAAIVLDGANSKVIILGN